MEQMFLLSPSASKRIEREPCFSTGDVVKVGEFQEPGPFLVGHAEVPVPQLWVNVCDLAEPLQGVLVRAAQALYPGGGTLVHEGLRSCQ